MNKWTLSAAVVLMAAGYSADAMAARHYIQVIGESYGRSAEEAIDNAWRDADRQCYLSWGQSDQDITVLDEWIDPATGYSHARVSLGCTRDD
ncbi:hypothetical protein [Luteimonas sp. A649]